jgi:hypothetical protein
MHSMAEKRFSKIKMRAIFELREDFILRKYINVCSLLQPNGWIQWNAIINGIISQSTFPNQDFIQFLDRAHVAF